MNEETSEEALAKGRLRAEDRGGRIGEQYLDPEEHAEVLALQDPEENWKEEPRDHRGRHIMLAFAIGTVLASIAFLVFFFSLKPKPAIRNHSTNTAPPPSFVEKASPIEIERAIEDCVSGFMNATTNEERCRFLMGGDSLLASLDEYYGRPTEFPPKDYGKIYQSNQAAFGGVPIHSIFALEKEGTSGWVFNILPTQSEMKIDWGSSVGYGDRSWEDFTTSKPQESITMRVYLARATAESQVADPRKFGFCKIYTRGNDESFPGFFLRKSKIASSLKYIIPRGGRQPVKVKLRWNTDGSAIEILELVHNFWIDFERYQQEFQKGSEIKN